MMREMIQFIQENPIIFKMLVSAVFLLAYIKLVSIVNKLLSKAISDNGRYFTTMKKLNYLHLFVVLVIFLIIWSEARLDLTIYIGLISAGIAISLREIFTNIAAMLVVLVQKPFEVGDQITVNGYSGDVIDQKIFHFVVMEVVQKGGSSGKIVNIPNNYIFLHPIANASKGFDYIWNEIELELSLESDWKLAKEQFEAILYKHTGYISVEAQNKLIEASKKYLIHNQKLAPSVYITVGKANINLTLRYLTEPRSLRDTESLLWQEILQCVDENEKIILARTL